METDLANTYQKGKLLVKCLVIAGLILLLLIPGHFVKELVLEREKSQDEAYKEVSSKWAGSQSLTGPVLVLPFIDSVTDSNGFSERTRKNAYVLPDQLSIRGTLDPEERHRGVYQVMLYSSRLEMRGSFQAIPFDQLQLRPDQILWQDAYVCVGLTDQHGLKEEIRLKWNDADVTLTPLTTGNAVMKEGFFAPVSISPADKINFSSTIHFKGSRDLSFVPVGKETSVELSSSWKDPSFIGAQLPDHRLTKDGFTASWKSLAHTRTYPQAWQERYVSMAGAAFGTNVFIPVNNYQKVLRSVKYAILFIVLTFAAFFIMEMMHNKSVHPLQYALVGMALLLFYTLLLSFSEYIGFELAYLVASVATVGLIGWFVKQVLQSGRLGAVLSVLLVLLYSYVFTILQSQDYALLLGSIGLFLMLAVVMHFSRKIQW